jgi:hypothetical protein
VNELNDYAHKEEAMMGLNESSLNQIDILIGKAQETA